MTTSGAAEPRASAARGLVSASVRRREVMTMLRAMAIMKTDIRGSTAHFRMLPEVDLEALLTEHHQFVSRLAKAHDGRVVKAEGDGFWVVFPSVTAAKLGSGESIEALLESHPRLTCEGVLAALRFAAQALRADVVYPISTKTA